ncbi:MAG: phage holin family protein [Anaerolineales bacterium]|nr:phage holin family protein [Anaerolineales bacterium]
MKLNLKMRHMRWNLRVLWMWLLMSLWAGILFLIIPSVSFGSFLAAVLATLVVGYLNAWVRPVLVTFSISPTLMIFGSIALLMNAGLLWAGNQFPLWMQSSGLVGPGIFVFLVSSVNVTFSDLLAIDDDDSYYAHLVYQIIHLADQVEESDVPGVIFLEVDGLSEPVLRRAIADGFMPTLNDWLESGTHQLAYWECDLSSQTSASQAGILLGSNFDIPAFRWYEKDQQKRMVSNNPADSAAIERRLSTGDGLLINNGASRSNLFSGDAPNAIFTFSTITDLSKHSTKDFYPALMGPYNFIRILLLFVWDVVSELRAAWHQRRHDIHPRVQRGGYYPLLRAATTVLLQELSVHILMGDMIAGVPCVYATFVGYDEVAHHSGIERPDVLEVLKKLDAQFDRLQEITRLAPRPYKFVILSDHGQSQGATFKQRYGMSLEQVVRDLVSPELEIELIHSEEAGWSNISIFLSDLLQDVIPGSEKFTARLIKRFAEQRMVLDQVVLGPYRDFLKQFGPSSEPSRADVVVLASGNLGLIYFTNWRERLSLEQINKEFPDLIEELAQHEGIGFLLVHSDRQGPMIIGAEGNYFLEDNHIEGVNPLADFGKNAPQHLLRTSSFPHVADIMVNSLYDPETSEVAAFEELVGSHGGLGGSQSKPFVLFPSEWDPPPNPIIGAAQLHRQLKAWLRDSS